MTSVKCPNCARDFVRRVARNGLAEVSLSLFYIYPFKCQLCGERFRLFQRGVRYVKVKEDRREYDRMEMSFPVKFHGEDISGDGMVLNVSMGGCSFSTAADLAIGTIVKLELHVSAEVPPVIAEAAVVRNARAGSAGVEFLRWHPAERERLQLFVRGLLIDRGAQLEPLVPRPESLISR